MCFIKYFLVLYISISCYGETCFDLRHKAQELLKDSFKHKENMRLISQCNELDRANYYAEAYTSKCSRDFNENGKLLKVILRELTVYCDN